MVPQILEWVSEELKHLGLWNLPFDNFAKFGRTAPDLRPVEMSGYFTIGFIDA